MLIISVFLLVVALFLLWREKREKTRYQLTAGILARLVSKVSNTDKFQERKILEFRILEAFKKDNQESITDLKKI